MVQKQAKNVNCSITVLYNARTKRRECAGVQGRCVSGTPAIAHMAVWFAPYKLLTFGFVGTTFIRLDIQK